MDERRGRISTSQMEVIEKRLQANRAKVHQNKGVPGLESDVEKLEESIRTVSFYYFCNLYYD